MVLSIRFVPAFAFLHVPFADQRLLNLNTRHLPFVPPRVHSSNVYGDHTDGGYQNLSL